jgi:hypothetical protein
MDDDQTESPGPREAPPISLDEFLVACQKSLARSARNAEQTSRSAAEFATGQQALYMIDGLEFDVSTAVVAPGPDEADRQDRVLLDFSAPAERRSRVKFRVESRPMEVIPGARLEMAQLSGPSEPDGRVRFRAWLVDDQGSPVPDYPVQLYFARSGSKRRNLRKPIAAKTDVVGRIDFYVDTEEDTVKIVGVRERHRVFLRGDAREYFVWAVADRADDWETVVEPSPPRPPIKIERGSDGKPRMLYTQVLQHKIGRGE